MNDWNLIEEVGGEERLRALLRTFYDRMFEDLLIGFLFEGKDRERLVESQLQYVTANLGDRSGTYEGPPIRKAHAHLPILPGHFDRRHTLLKEALVEYDVPDRVRTAWLEFDRSLRPLVVNTGATARDSLLSE